MIYSMTGYGRAEKSGEGKKITVEIYSVNSKNADVNVHIPGHLRALEQETDGLLAEILGGIQG